MSYEFFKILGVMFDSKFTFERHIRSISSSVAQKIGLLRKSFKIFGDHDVLLRCFNSFILPCLEYCSPVWSSAADSHLKLLDKILRACKFLFQILQLVCSTIVLLAHCVCFTRSLTTLPILSILNLPTCSVPGESLRGSLSISSLSFSPMRFHTSQYSRCFIPITTKLWNELPSMIVEATELQKLKTGANAFLLGVDEL